MILCPACRMLGPDYVAPTAQNYPQQWTQHAAHPVQQDGKDRTAWQQWWRGFNDPVLNQLLEQAFAANQDMAIAAQRMVQARAQRDLVASRRQWQVGGQIDLKSQRSAKALQDPPGIGGSQSYRLGLDASWEIDVFGRQRRALEAADAELDAFMADQQTVKLLVLAEVANRYIELRRIQQHIQLAQQEQKILAQLETFARKSYQQGLASRLPLQQAEIEKQILQAKQAQLAADEAETGHAIAVLLGGFSQDIQQSLQQNYAQLPQLPPLPETVPSQMLQHRPDIRAAERRLAAASAQIGVADAERFPRFVIPLSLGSAASHFADLFSADSIFAALGLAMQSHIDDGGGKQAKLHYAEAEYRIQALAYAQGIRVAFQDVEDHISHLNAAKQQQLQLQLAFTQSSQSLSQAKRLYQRGLRPYHSVLELSRQHILLQQQLLNSEASYVQQGIGLYKAFGMGW
ncbi:hypothetical protein BFG52_10315 [Acinetobacter larvae]|uniref:RND transporter n=2 Tax=Acinetobacter larvae TaxID=1789224 RepID=A0A1B2M468_9GAMM|nr:hypothetical protein BFG52_10315 [Acinetobacter larvae]